MKLYRKTDDKTYQGGPAGDVTEDQFARLSPRGRHVVLHSGSWEVETIRKDEAPEDTAPLTTAALEAEATAAATSGTSRKKG